MVSRLLGELGKLECSTTELAEVLAALVEHSPVPLWIYDENQLIVYNNRSSCRFGTGDNVVGSHVDTFSPQIREMLKEGLAACRSEGEACTKEGWISSHVIGERYLRFDFLPLPNRLVACLSHDSTENKRVEAALQASEERTAFFADMLERALMPFAATYPGGRILIANKAFCELTGYGESELHSISLFGELTAADYEEQESLALHLLRSTGHPQQYEKLLVRKDGSTVPVEMLVQQVDDDEGNPRRISAFVTDISERKRAGVALRESEERFRLVCELATDGIWDWRIGAEEEFLSPRFKQMLGYDDRELDNRADAWERLIHPDDLPMAKQTFRDHLEHGKPFHFIARYFHKNGSVVWVTCRGKAIKDSKGKFYRVVGTHTDDTERKLAEERIAEAHEFNQKIIATSSVGIVVSKASGQCVLVNEAAARFIGASCEEILQQNFRHLESWRQSGLLAAADIALQSGSMQSGEFHLVTTFGKEVWWDCSLTPFHSNGEPHLLTIINDISKRRLAEIALRESQEHLALALEGAADGIWDYDVRTNTTYRSSHVSLLLGYGAEGLLPTADAWLEIVHPDDLAGVLEAWQSHMAGKTEQYVSEHRLRTVNGDYIWVLDSGKIVERDEHQQPLRVAGTHKNITERKLAEAALLQAYKEWESTFDTITDMITIHDADFNVLRANKAAKESLSLPTIGGKLNSKCFKCYHGTEQPPDNCPSCECLRTHLPSIQELYEPHLGQYIEIRAIPTFDAEDRMTGLIHVVRNISERKRDEEALRESESKYRRLVELASEGIWVDDINDVITFVNPQMAKMLGYEPADMLGHKTTEFMAEEDLARNDAGELIQDDEIGAVRRRGERSTYERRYKHANGSYVWCQVSGTPLLNEDGQYLGSFGVFTDITERKRAEAEHAAFEEYVRQSQKMEALGTLAGGIAHDFNNVLCAILGFGNLIMENMPPESQDYENVQLLLAAGHRAKELVQQILAFSRKSQVVAIPLDLASLIEEDAKLLRAAFATTLEIKLSLQPVTAVVLADPTEIHQVLMNLCTNAAHAVGNNQGVLEVGLREAIIGAQKPAGCASLTPGLYLELSISDTGEGIPPEIQQRIFDPFFTTKAPGKGTGMGLSVVHGIVRKLGGEVVVESGIGDGSRFTIFLPATHGIALDAHTDECTMPAGDASILVVDDEADILSVLRQWLTSLGYHVTCCNSIQEALVLLAAEPRQLDLLITDHAMPEGTGLDLAKQALAIQPKLPIILATGYSQINVVESARSLGITEFLHKPILKAELAAAVHRALQQSSSGTSGLSGEA